MKVLLAIFFFTQVQLASALSPVEQKLKEIAADSTYYSTKLTEEEIVAFNKFVENLVQDAYNMKDSKLKIYDSFYPKDLYHEYFDAAQAFYLNGYATSQNFNQWHLDYKQLINFNYDEIDQLHANLSEEERIELRFKFVKAELVKVHKKYIEAMNNTTIGCASEGEDVYNKKCCANHVRQNLVIDDPSRLKCQVGGKTCTSNSSCCSGMCYKENPNEAGKCVAPKYCTKIRAVNEACSDQHYYCKNSRCIDYDKLDRGSLSCKHAKKSCTKSEECCSGSCNSGVCAEKVLCLQCKSLGSSVKDSETCCPGLIKLNNKCSLPYPTFIPTVYKIQNTFKKIVRVIFHNVFISDAHADNADFSNDDTDLNLSSSNSSTTITSSSSSSSNSKKLTSSQIRKLAQKRIYCSGLKRHNKDLYNTCMAEADELEQKYTSGGETEGESEEQSSTTSSGLTATQEQVLAERRVDCATLKSIDRTALKSCLASVNALEQQYLTGTTTTDSDDSTENSEKAEYMTNYEIPGVTAKTYSDLKSCEFNSFNDNWKDASTAEKNAELFLRAFEYVYSHKGTQDYWEDSGKGNIFSRANAAAIEFRKHRVELLAKMQEIDKKMFCSCIPVYGLENFSEEKQTYYNANCSTSQSSLQASSSDSTSESVGEVESGGIGISHEKLLVEWLEYRAEAQLARFELNSSLEEDLIALSEFITNQNFIEVYQDQMIEKQLIPGSPAGDSFLLYKWGYKVKEGTIASVLGTSDKNRYKASTSSYTGSSHAMKAAWRYEEDDDIDSSPQIIDVQTKRERGSVLSPTVFYGFHRYYIGPRFSKTNTSVDSCNVYGRATACFKSAYKVQFGDETNYILDPTLPLFVDSSLIALEVMDGTSSPFTTLLNEAKDKGVSYLQSLLPKNKKEYGYYKVNKNYGKEEHLNQAVELGYFQPKQGELVVKSVEEEYNGAIIANAIKKGAQTYIECKNLKTDCSASDVEDSALGFGYLFESSEDAAKFAEYIYEIHWKWSHITKNNYMGYPLQGLEQYFSLVSYNMKLVGSTALSRAMSYNETADLYRADWEQRESDYGTTSNIESGTDDSVKSSFETKENTAYDVLANINLNGTTNLEVYDRAMSDAVKSGNLSSGDVSILTSARNSAVKRNEDIAESEELSAALATSDTATQNAYNANKASLEKINSPIASAGLSSFNVRGSGVSTLSDVTSSSSSSGSSSKDTADTDSTAKAKTALGLNYGNTASANNYSSNLASLMGSSPSLTSFGSSTSIAKAAKGINYSKDSGLSKQQVSNMIKEFSKNDLNGNEADSIFGLVSKAYKRNYGKILTRIEAEQVKNDEKKSELKALLEE